VSKSLFVLLALAAGAPLAAQVPHPKVDAAPLLGTWEGPYTSDHASGGLRLVITRDTVWKATLGSAPETMFPETSVDEFKVEGNNLSWTQAIMGAACSATAALEGSALKGELACDHDGTAVRISFLLVKR
jgi:hypothetical protein